MTTVSVQQEWLRRAAAEYASATVTAELLQWLLCLRASDDALAACHRIVDDELVHGRLSLAVHRSAGGGEALPVPAADAVVGAAVLPHDPGAPLLFRALAVAADVFCCHEGVAVPLFRAMHEDATAPPAQEALARILRDEGRHRAFGWTLLDELLPRAGPAGAAFLAARVPGYLAQARAAYTTAPRRRVSAIERAWGLQPPQAYAAAVNDALRDDIEPRFRQAGVLEETPRSQPKKRASR